MRFRPFARTRLLPLPLPLLLPLLLPLHACDGGDAPDVPTTANVLNSYLTGGRARVVSIVGVDATGTSMATYVYGDDLTSDCTAAWDPQGSLCDDDRASPTDRGSPLVSAKSNEDSGATFRTSSANPPVRGILVVDACAEPGCTTVTFDQARVFQMFSDGKTTHLRLSVHPSTDAVPPTYDDAGWVDITGMEAIGAGTLLDTVGLEVGDPTVLGLPESTTRYVRIEVWNDGTHGDPSYTELRSLKLFDVTP